MADIVRVLSASDPEWDRWLADAPHDFYHLASYHRFSERVGEGKAEMVVYGTPERFIAWPYLICDIDETHQDSNSVYGYTGPTGRGLDDDTFRDKAWQALLDVWRDRNLVTLFTRFHPLLENDRYCDGFSGSIPTPGGEILHLGRSVSIDLTDDRVTRRSKYRQALRQQIKRAEANGLTVELDTDWQHFQRFIDLYTATMGRNAASDRYLFSNEYFSDLKKALNGHAHLAVAKYEGEVVGTMLFTVCDGIAEAHLAGTDSAHVKLSPLKGLVDGVSDMAGQMGAKRFHIGAGRGGNEDSLYDFKSRFSTSRHNFRVGRWVLDSAAYADLSQQKQSMPNAVFFPAYRAEGVTEKGTATA